MSPHRVGMYLEERGCAPQRQDLLGRRFAAVGRSGHGGLAGSLRPTGTVAKVILGGAMLLLRRIPSADTWRADRRRPLPSVGLAMRLDNRVARCPKFVDIFRTRSS